MKELGAVRHAAHDRLDRQRFAASLASYISKVRASDEGYVIGLEGPWGSGKSSIINMLREELLHLEMARKSVRPVFRGDVGSSMSMERLRELAPLHTSTTYDPLTVDLAYFTHDVVNKRHAQRAAADPDLACDLYRYYRLYKTIADDGEIISISFEPWLIPESSELASVFVRELARAIGERLGSEVERAFELYWRAVAELAPIAGAALDGAYPGAGTALQVMSGWLPTGQKLPPTLEERKGAVETALRRLKNRKVLVTIDDLDRLTPREASEMVGLVKGLGRLPNVIYLLSYDVDNLEKLVQLGTRLDGRSYLEKIVQYKRSTPPSNNNALSRLFNEFLQGVKPDIVGPAGDRLAEAWRLLVLPALSTPRDALRLGGMFRAGWDSVGEHLDPSDFLLLQFTQLTDPSLYSFIRTHLRLLCGLDRSVSATDLSNLISAETFDSKGSASVLSWLFPSAAIALGRYNPGSGASARSDRRLQAFDYWQSYLELIIPDDMTSYLEVGELVASKEPGKKLKEMLERSESAERPAEVRSQFLDDLRQHYGDGTSIPPDIALALVNESPGLIQEDRRIAANLLDDANATRIQSILLRGLVSTPRSARAALLLKLIHESDDLSVVASVCRTAIGPVKTQDADGRRVDMEGREADVVDGLLAKIEANQTLSWVFEQAIPGEILFFWRDHAVEARVSEFTAKASRSRKYFPRLVNFLISGVRSTGAPYYWEYIPRWASDFVDLPTLDRIANRYLKSSDSKLVEAAGRYLAARETPESGPDSK